MTRNKFVQWWGGIICLMGFVGIGGITLAQTPSEEFPTTRQGIVEKLQRNQTNGLQLKGIRPKGPEAIVEDYKVLVQENPSAKALILFDLNSSTIKESSYALLREYAQALQGELRDAAFVIAGHTDSKGTDAYNLGLSERRAEAVKMFLVETYQIAPERLIVKGYGEQEPIAENATDEGRQLNRRVEFIAMW